MIAARFQGLHSQRGVGLIEVLVAVLVLSIGLLGLAGLQLRTLRNNESALQRGVAVVETHAIADAMRADRVNALLFNIALTDPAPTGNTFHEYAVRAWRTNLVNALGPTAKGRVTCNGNECDIEVQWDDTRATAGSATQSLITTVRL